jgi:hypothetical protein
MIKDIVAGQFAAEKEKSKKQAVIIYAKLPTTDKYLALKVIKEDAMFIINWSYNSNTDLNPNRLERYDVSKCIPTQFWCVQNATPFNLRDANWETDIPLGRTVYVYNWDNPTVAKYQLKITYILGPTCILYL